MTLLREWIRRVVRLREWMRRVARRFVVALAAVLAVLCMCVPSALAAMQGYDVSSWQPADVTRLVDGDLAVVKVSEGTGYINPVWQSQADGAVDTGKALGLYHYADGGDAVSEADRFVNAVAGYVGTAVLALDWESYGNRAWGDGEWVWRFVSRVHDRTRVWPLVYVQASAIGQIPQRVWDVCGLWVAQYASMSATGYQSDPWRAGAYGEAMRQYASTGRLPGYAGNLDLDVFWGERWQWDAYARGDGATVADVVSPPASGSSGSSGVSTCVVVRSGDTITAIADRTGLRPWNLWSGYGSGNPNLIYAGETLCYGGSSVSSGGSRVYVVRSGDSLWSVFGSDWSRVASLNALSNPSLIYPGQKLVY